MTLAWQWSGTRWELRPPDQAAGLRGISAVATVRPDGRGWKWCVGEQTGKAETAAHARWAVEGLIHKQRGGGEKES